MYVCVWIYVGHVTPTEPILMGMAIDYSVDVHATFNSSSWGICLKPNHTREKLREKASSW